MKAKRYYLDTEFISGFRKPLFGRKRHFIDLISIGLVDDAGREFYAVSEDFDLNYAWKDKWIRQNVLRPIFYSFYKPNLSNLHHDPEFTRSNMRGVIKAIGRSDKQIANDIRGFVYGPAVAEGEGMDGADADIDWWLKENTIEFYAYYADYDWVLFCSLFGRMIDLPTGFPMYCRDLKQTMDEQGLSQEWKRTTCPDPFGEHNALVDAKWNQKLHRAIKLALV